MSRENFKERDRPKRFETFAKCRKIICSLPEFKDIIRLPFDQNKFNRAKRSVLLRVHPDRFNTLEAKANAEEESKNVNECFDFWNWKDFWRNNDAKYKCDNNNDNDQTLLDFYQNEFRDEYNRYEKESSLEEYNNWSTALDTIFKQFEGYLTITFNGDIVPIAVSDYNNRITEIQKRIRLSQQRWEAQKKTLLDATPSDDMLKLYMRVYEYQLPLLEKELAKQSIDIAIYQNNSKSLTDLSQNAKRLKALIKKSSGNVTCP